MSKAIRFNYLYRDSGNYKKFGSKIFSNPEKRTIEDINKQLSDYLIDQQFFYPEKAGIEKFRFHRYQDDTSWYEFESTEEINYHSSHKNRETINHFISIVKNDG
jgi:hypothetical protein